MVFAIEYGISQWALRLQTFKIQNFLIKYILDFQYTNFLVASLEMDSSDKLRFPQAKSVIQI